MADDKKFIKDYSLLVFFLLTIAITWGGIFLVAGIDGISGAKTIPDDQMPLLYLATLLGPSISGVLLTILVDGKHGFRSLLSRLSHWRVSPRWYLIALLTAPLLITAILLLLSRSSTAYLPTVFAGDSNPGLLITGIFMGLIVGFFEELGWTGFAIPRLRKRFNIIATGLIVGLIWGLWHFPLFAASAHSSGSIPPVIYIFILLFSFLPAYRVLMVWVYDQTGSLLISILMHAPLAASQLLLIPAELSGAKLVSYDLLFAATLWLIVLAIGVISRRKTQNAPESHI